MIRKDRKEMCATDSVYVFQHSFIACESLEKFIVFETIFHLSLDSIFSTNLHCYAIYELFRFVGLQV